MPNEVVFRALGHSALLRVAREEVHAAEARRIQAQAVGLPSVDIRAGGYWYQGLEDSALGTTLVIPAIEERYSASIGVTQPLFTGGRISGRRKGTVLERGAAVETCRATEADLVLDALSTYWTWSKAYYGVESLRDAVARMEAHNTDMQNLHDAGLATDNDALATEVLMEQTRLQLEQALHNLDVVRARLAYLMGRDLPAGAVPERAEPISVKVPDEGPAFAVAATNRSELAARRLDTEASTALLRASRGDFFPQVSLVARYEQANPNQLDFPPEETWNDDAFAGAALSWNVLDWGLTRGRAAEARARMEQARIREEEAADRVRLEVREARIGLDDALRRAAVAERVESSAQRNLEAATDLWKNGLARHADVLDAHAQLTDAEYQTLAAQTDILVAQAVVAHSVGRLNAEAIAANPE